MSVMARQYAGEAGVATAWRRWGISPLIVICVLVVGVVVVFAIFGPVIAPQNPMAQNLNEVLAKPGHGHLLGTDQLGRDVFSRLIVGARTAMDGPLVIALGSMLVGNLLGLLAGYRGGSWDAVIMRWVDLMSSIPGLLVIVVVIGSVGGGYWAAAGLLLLLSIPFTTRVVRGAALEQAPRPYVEAAKTLGVSNWRIMVLHIWPNVAPIAAANAFLEFVAGLIGLAGLSFLGFGAAVGSPDWGATLAAGTTLLFANPVAILAPCVMIVATATSMSLLGDWLYERLASRGATR